MSRAFIVFFGLVSFVFAAGASSESNPPAASPQPMSQPALPLMAKADTKAMPAPTGVVPLAGVDGNGAPTQAQIQPYRTFIEIARYNMENNGEPKNPVSNVRLTVTFPNQSKVQLPEGGQWWPIGNGQAQEIHRIYELPFSYIQGDGFKFAIQMERQGSPMLPCNFDVVQLSQFNRSYSCHTDIAWQQNQNMTAEQLDKEGIQVRVFTDKNSEKKEIPNNALAIR
jgi:hypothetical protein